MKKDFSCNRHHCRHGFCHQILRLVWQQHGTFKIRPFPASYSTASLQQGVFHKKQRKDMDNLV